MNNLAIDEIYSPFSFPASSVFTFDARSPAATGLFPSKKYLHDNVPARPNCNALMDCHTPVSAVADTTSASTPAANEVSTPDPTRLSNTSAGAADAAIAIARSVNKTRRQSNCPYEDKNKLTIEISRALQHPVTDEHRRVQGLKRRDEAQRAACALHQRGVVGEQPR